MNKSHCNLIASRANLPRMELEEWPDEVDPVKIHEYPRKMGVLGGSAIQAPGGNKKRPSRSFVVAAHAKQAIKNIPGPRISRQDAFAEKAHGARRDSHGISAIRSTQIRDRASAGFTGQKNGGKQDALAESMKNRLTEHYNILHAK